MKILIKNGRILDPSQNLDKVTDLVIVDDKIQSIGKAQEADYDKVIDATGKWVMPGFVDLHVHFRDPGLEYKETVETGCAAAIHGGFTSVFAMPNTKPVADSPEVISYVQKKGQECGIHVYQVGSVTKNMEGKELSDLEGMFKAGCIAISEDGKSVMDSGLYREAMKICAAYNIPIFAHCEDINLVQKGVMNLDENSKKLGLRGISNAVEDIIVARDILLAKETGAKLHLCHCSTKDSVSMVKLAKEEGLPVSAEVCPHHFALCSDDIKENAGCYKMNPPLRSHEDMISLQKGLADGIMEVISTDHAPHGEEEKAKPMEEAPFGIVGLETSFALSYTYLVKTGMMSPLQLVEKMSTNPAKVANIAAGSLKVGKKADLAIAEVENEYVIDTASFKSKGKSTPFAGMAVYGDIFATICDGKILMENGEK